MSDAGAQGAAAAGGAAGGGGQGGGAAGQGAAGAGAGASGGGGEAFFAAWGLDDAHRDFVTGKGFKDPAAIVKSAREADAMVRSRNVIDAPDPTKLAEWNGWEKLGWTKDAGAYKLADAQVPGNLAYDKGMEAEFVKLAHEARVPVHQAQAMRDGLLKVMAAQFEARASTSAKEQADLRTALQARWGADYQANSDLAARAARALGLDLATSVELEKLTGAPRLLEMFATIGKSLGEDTLRRGDGGGAKALSPNEAASEQRRLAGDKEFMKALGDARHPQHADVQARWTKLIEAKVGARG